MKKNLPVTRNELVLRDDTLIVTTTDLKGIITYVNREFVEVSGFAEAELVGASHNVVRHPDMPAEAFADLWKALKAGRPWKGCVKNRRKNGDFYWVEAHVAPIWKDDKVTGYMSARRKAPREQVEAAEAAYRLFRENKARGIAIQDGAVVSTGWLARLRDRLAHTSVATKMVAGCVFATVLIMGAVSLVLGQRMSEVLAGQGVVELQQKLQLISDMVGMRAAALAKEAGRLNDVFAASFPEPFSLEDGADMPVLKHGDAPVNQHYTEVDAFTRLTGAVATLFARRGDEFVRVSTSVKKQDGGRAIGTTLDRTHPGYARLLAGERYTGKVLLFGRDYYTSYSPIRNKSGEVIGASFVGLDASAEIGALRDKIREVKAGSTGYFFVLDARPGKDYGSAVVHPVQQGTNLLSTRDADGHEFMREMLEKKHGTIRYPWADAKSGDAAVRTEVAVFDTNPEWQWLIAGSTFADEFETPARAMQQVLWTVPAIVALAIVGLIYGLVRTVIHKPLRRQVLPAFRKLSEGKYDNPLDLSRNDEIGKVLQGLEAMQSRLGYEVAEARKKADEMARVRYALTQVTIPVTVADEHDSLLYMNRAARDLWQRMAPEIARRNPDFAVERMLGARLSALLGSDAGILLAAETAADTTVLDVALGGRALRLTASPVRNEQGQHLGRVIQWLDRTDEIAVEQEVGTIVLAAGKGDFAQRIALEGKDGFFRQLAEGINTLTRTSEVGLQDVARLLEALARGDLTGRIVNDYQGSLGELKDYANTVVDKLTGIVGSIKDSTESVNVAAREIASGNTDLSGRTESQASSLEKTAASMEQLTATVRQNAESARQANTLAAGASAVAVKGGEVVGQVVTTMGSINESSKKIADIIGVIDGIAFQTNILALNAAVEAARAGEQGRGFAVVATEVRMLAQRSAAAAKEIKALIGESVDKVGAGTKLVDDAGRTMRDIVSSVKRVTDIMAEITAASQEQSAGIEEVNQAITQMDEATQQNAALVEQAAAAAESLEEQAGSLAGAVSVFRLSRPLEMQPATRPAADPKVSSLSARRRPATSDPAPATNRPRSARAAGGDAAWTE